MAFRIYGADHSPWVQAVLLGAHEKRIDHTLTTSPPWPVFLRWGVLMPAASVDGDPWQVESSDILERMGYAPISPVDRRAVLGAWRGVLHRPDSISRFFYRFSLAGDPSPSSLRRLGSNFLRSFATLYFCLLIRFAVMRSGYNDPENFGDQFLYFEEKLANKTGQFIGGDSPDMTDLMLFGIIQCHSSIPVPPTAALQRDPRLARLRDWIAAMQLRFSAYPPLYSGADYPPHLPTPRHASVLDQAAFWLGSAVNVICFPVTVPSIVFLVIRVQRLRHQRSS